MWMNCYLIFILSITVRECHNSRSILCASQTQSHQEFLHCCCVLADGDIFVHHLLPPFLLACFSPDTAFLTPIQGALIKRGRTNNGTPNLLEPPTLDPHSCLGPGAALRDFSPWQTCWELARWKNVLPLRASRDSRFRCFWAHCHRPIINCSAAETSFYLLPEYWK